MRRTAAILAGATAALALAGTAAAADFGVADDRGKYADDGGAWFYPQLREVGMSVNRISVFWDETAPTSIVELGFLARSLPVAQAAGVEIMFAVYPKNPRALGASPAALAQFADFLAAVARTFPQVRQFVVGNEPNVNRFHQPQCSSAETYADVLAAGYDALKAVDPTLVVISSVSPRGNDNCNARSNPSASPVRFVKRLSDRYKASRRTEPLFDHFGMHIYPARDSDPLAKGYQWPNAGFPNLDRVMQAVHDGFAGTAQPTFSQGVRFVLGEIGWQVEIPPAHAGAYHGRESVRATDEETQARIYGEIVSRYGCDPAIRSLLFFGFADEADLERWQAGLLRADLSRRASYDAVKAGIASAASCRDRAFAWRPSTTVAGAGATFRLAARNSFKRTFWSFNATATEEATYEAGIYPVAAGKSLKARRNVKPVLTKKGTVKANYKPLVRFPARRLKPGAYEFRITLKAAMNPSRTASFTSRAFRVG